MKALTRYLTLACLAAGALPAAPAASAPRTELLRLEEHWIAAIERQDVATLDRILADDFLDTGYDGARHDKREMLARLRRGGPARSQRLAGMAARLLGGGPGAVGLVTGVNEVKGAGYAVRVRFLDVFVRRDGRWQAVAAHETLVLPR